MKFVPKSIPAVFVSIPLAAIALAEPVAPADEKDSIPRVATCVADPRGDRRFEADVYFRDGAAPRAYVRFLGEPEREVELIERTLRWVPGGATEFLELAFSGRSGSDGSEWSVKCSGYVGSRPFDEPWRPDATDPTRDGPDRCGSLKVTRSDGVATCDLLAHH